MPRQRKRKGGPQLGYSTNVHRGETLEQVYDFLRDYTVPIRQKVYDGASAGLELRLGIGSARELRSVRARRALREFLDENGLRLFSVNAFPLRDFHARRVKEQVYKPSWAEKDRARWTARIAEVVADLAPEDVAPSISTLGGCYRRERHDERTFDRMAGLFLEALDTFLELERAGRPMVLAVEPEPETTFETATDVIRFVEDHLLPAAFEHWKDLGARQRIEETVRRLFTVNVDTCHLSVLFEDPVESLRELERAGVRVGKLHATNAVALRHPWRSPKAWEDLRGMDEPRYFHQCCGVDGEGRVVWRELDLDRMPERLVPGEHPHVREIRSHFHVPLYLRRYRRLHTTRDETEAAVRETLRRGLTDHIVLETYTWPIIAGGEDRREQLVAGITREYRWLLGVLEDAGHDGGR